MYECLWELLPSILASPQLSYVGTPIDVIHPATVVNVSGLIAAYRLDSEVIQAGPGLLSAYYYDDIGARIVTTSVTMLDHSIYMFNFDSSNVLPPITNLTIELDVTSIVPGSDVAKTFVLVTSHGNNMIVPISKIQVSKL